MIDEHRILVVEDDEATRDALTLVLQASGYQVTTAANGQEALDALREPSPPCLILLDLMMPVMDGWQFRALQRQDPALAVIPVVLVSADGNTPQKAASLGAAGFIQKPVDVHALLDTVQRHC
jgi:CheY-like chemotaxis protein